MRDKLILRPAVPEDTGAIQRIYSAALGSSASGPILLSTENMIVAEGDVRYALDCRRTIISKISDKLKHIGHDQQIIGFGGLDLNAIEQLKWIYVDPKYQDAGVGSSILTRLEEDAFAKGVAILRLHATPQAVTFYLKYGYTRVAEKDQIEHDHEGVEMMKQLRSIEQKESGL